MKHSKAPKINPIEFGYICLGEISERFGSVSDMVREAVKGLSNGVERE